MQQEVANFRAKFEEEAASLPPEWEHSYEKKINALFDSEDDRTIAIAACESILEDRSVPEPIRYAAFCALHLHHRHMSDHQDLMDLCERYENDFEPENHPSKLHFLLLKNVDLGEPVSKTQIDMAQQSALNMHETQGAENLLADLIATYYEKHGLSLDDQEAVAEIQLGLNAVNKAIMYDENYAKFYSTRGRLLSLLGQFDNAKQDITRALMKEDSSRNDYALRCARYEAVRSRIEANELKAKLDKEMQGHVSELDSRIQKLNDSATNNLEFLGLFAGIISFTIGGISIASSASEFSFLGAGGLLIILMGAELIVFSGFSIVLHGFGNKKEFLSPVVTIMGIGIIMVVVGAMMCGGIFG